MVGGLEADENADHAGHNEAERHRKLADHLVADEQGVFLRPAESTGTLFQNAVAVPQVVHARSVNGDRRLV